ncbi:MAG: hypothetical protein ACD_62C00313G0005, partial [uncultured bacterium]
MHKYFFSLIMLVLTIGFINCGGSTNDDPNTGDPDAQ